MDCDDAVLRGMLHTIVPSKKATLSLRLTSQLLRNVIPLQSDAAFFSQVQSVDELCLWTTEKACRELTFQFSDSDSQISLTFHIQMGSDTATDWRDPKQAAMRAAFRKLAGAFRLSTVKKLRVQLASLLMSTFDNPKFPLATLLRSTPEIEHLIVFLYESVDEQKAIDFLWYSLPDLKTVHIAKRYHGELPSTWMPIPTLHAVISQAANGGARIHKLTCSAISSISRERPFYELDWQPEDVVVDGQCAMDFVDELVLDCVECDKDLLDHPIIQGWNQRHIVF